MRSIIRVSPDPSAPAQGIADDTAAKGTMQDASIAETYTSETVVTTSGLDAEKAADPQQQFQEEGVENQHNVHTQRRPLAWGNYVSVGITVLAVICSFLMSKTTSYESLGMLFFALAALLEFTVGYSLHRRYGWVGYGKGAATRFCEETSSLGLCRIAKLEDGGDGPATVDGVERKSGYKGKLFDAFPLPRHFAEALRGEPGKDLQYGFKRIAGSGILAMAFMAVSVLVFTLPTSGIAVDWSPCVDDGCKMAFFEQQIYRGDECQTRSDDEAARKLDKSSLEGIFPHNAFNGLSRTARWAFMNIGTTMNTIVFRSHTSPDAMKTMWATSLCGTVVVALTTWLPYVGPPSTLADLLALLVGFVNALHCLLLELCSTPKCFRRFNWPNTMGFLAGFFVHFLCGIIVLTVVSGVDAVISRLTFLPSSSKTMVMSCLIKLGEIILQFVFSRLYEVPLAAATLQIFAYQCTLNSRIRLFFMTLPMSEMVSCAFVNMFTEIGIRGIMLPIKARNWNRRLQNVGPGKALSQQMGIYLSNLMSAIAAEHVAIFMIFLIGSLANPLVWSFGYSPLAGKDAGELFLRYVIQFAIALITDAIVVTSVVGFFLLSLKPYFDACNDWLFYIGVLMTLFQTVSLSFIFSPFNSCWFCEYHEECLAYLAGS